MAFSLTCDGIKRRDFLRIGALGTGIGLYSYLRLADAGEVAKSPAKSAIFINLTGGPSHMDTFDLKPEAPVEIRGDRGDKVKLALQGGGLKGPLDRWVKKYDVFAVSAVRKGGEKPQGVRIEWALLQVEEEPQLEPRRPILRRNLPTIN